MKLDDVQHSCNKVPFVWLLGAQGVGEDLRDKMRVPDKVQEGVPAIDRTEPSVNSLLQLLDCTELLVPLHRLHLDSINLFSGYGNLCSRGSRRSFRSWCHYLWPEHFGGGCTRRGLRLLRSVLDSRRYG